MDERVKTQSIIAVVRQVGHKYTDLQKKNTCREEDRGRRNGEKEIMLILFCKIVIKLKSHFPSCHVCEKLLQRSKSNYCCSGSRGKQIISQCVTVLNFLTEQLSTEYQYLPSLGQVTASLLLCMISVQ